VLPGVLLAVAAAILVCQFHEKVFQSPADGIHGNHFATGQPDFLNRPALSQRRYGDLDKSVLLLTFKHKRVNSLCGDHKLVLRFQQLGQSAHTGHAALDHNGQPIADLLDL